MSEGFWLVVGIVVGSVTTFIANLVADRIKNTQDNKQAKKNLRLILRIEFEGTLKYLDELKSDYNNSERFALKLINTLIKNINALENYKSNLYYLQDADLQRKVAYLITSLGLYFNEISGIESLAVDLQSNKKTITALEEDNKWFEKERRNKHVEIVDFRRQLEDIIQELS